MFKRAFFTLAFAVLLGLSSAAESVVLPEFAGCKPGSDDPIVTHEGLFKVHVVCDHLLLEIPDRMYKRDMLLNTEFAGLSGSSEFIAPGHTRGQPGCPLGPPRQQSGPGGRRSTRLRRPAHRASSAPWKQPRCPAS